MACVGMGLLVRVVDIAPWGLRGGGSCRGRCLRGRSSSKSLLIGVRPLLLVLSITICHSGSGRRRKRSELAIAQMRFCLSWAMELPGRFPVHV